MRTGVLDVKRWDILSVGGMVDVHAAFLSHPLLPLPWSMFDSGVHARVAQHQH